jgi:hypothetical protein
MEWSEGGMSLKNPVTPPGIDPGTVRLLAQRLNRYATPGPSYTRRIQNEVCSFIIDPVDADSRSSNIGLVTQL